MRDLLLRGAAGYNPNNKCPLRVHILLFFTCRVTCRNKIKMDQQNTINNKYLNELKKKKINFTIGT